MRFKVTGTYKKNNKKVIALFEAADESEARSQADSAGVNITSIEPDAPSVAGAAAVTSTPKPKPASTESAKPDADEPDQAAPADDGDSITFFEDADEEDPNNESVSIFDEEDETGALAAALSGDAADQPRQPGAGAGIEDIAGEGLTAPATGVAALAAEEKAEGKAKTKAGRSRGKGKSGKVKEKDDKKGPPIVPILAGVIGLLLLAGVGAAVFYYLFFVGGATNPTSNANARGGNNTSIITSREEDLTSFLTESPDMMGEIQIAKIFNSQPVRDLEAWASSQPAIMEQINSQSDMTIDQLKEFAWLKIAVSVPADGNKPISIALFKLKNNTQSRSDNNTRLYDLIKAGLGDETSAITEETYKDESYYYVGSKEETPFAALALENAVILIASDIKTMETAIDQYKSGNSTTISPELIALSDQVRGYDLWFAGQDLASAAEGMAGPGQAPPVSDGVMGLTISNEIKLITVGEMDSAETASVMAGQFKPDELKQQLGMFAFMGAKNPQALAPLIDGLSLNAEGSTLKVNGNWIYADVKKALEDSRIESMIEKMMQQQGGEDMPGDLGEMPAPGFGPGGDNAPPPPGFGN